MKKPERRTLGMVVKEKISERTNGRNYPDKREQERIFDFLIINFQKHPQLRSLVDGKNTKLVNRIAIQNIDPLLIKEIERITEGVVVAVIRSIGG